MKKILLFIFAHLLLITSWGQPSRGFVILKNGSVLKGVYQYSDNMEKLKVTSGKNTWVFDSSEIETITRSKPGVGVGTSDGTFEGIFLSPRLFNLTEIGVLAGNSDNSQKAPFVLGSSLNYPVWKNLSAGAGIGVEMLKETYVPLTGNLLYRFRNDWFTPYVTLQAGYQLPVEDSRTLYYDMVPEYWSSRAIWPGPWPNTQSPMEAKGGLLLNPSVGIMKFSNPGFGFSLSFGYRFHRLRYSGENDYHLDIDYNRLSVKLGIIIK